MIYGYARVSTDGQSVAAQVAQLTDAGAAKVFQETASGAKTDRRELARAIKALENGDTLLVTRLDRLARAQRQAPRPVKLRKASNKVMRKRVPRCDILVAAC